MSDTHVRTNSFPPLSFLRWGYYPLHLAAKETEASYFNEGNLAAGCVLCATQ